jgi:hypothetical protein
MRGDSTTQAPPVYSYSNHEDDTPVYALRKT